MWADRTSEPELGPERIRELVRLYRLAATDLNEARSWTADPELLGRLNALCGRGYRFVYNARRQGSFAGQARRFFAVELPAAFKRESRWVAAATAALLLGALLGAGTVLLRPAAAARSHPRTVLSPRARATGGPDRARRRADRPVEQGGGHGGLPLCHNIQVSFLAFSLAVSPSSSAFLSLLDRPLPRRRRRTYYLDGVSSSSSPGWGRTGRSNYVDRLRRSGGAGPRPRLSSRDLSRGAAVRAVFPRSGG